MDAPDKLAVMAGTHNVFEESRQLGRRALTRWERDTGADETGMGNRKVVQEFLIHPNKIRNLATGEAAVISSRMPEAPLIVTVNRANTRDD